MNNNIIHYLNEYEEFHTVYQQPDGYIEKNLNFINQLLGYDTKFRHYPKVSDPYLTYVRSYEVGKTSIVPCYDLFQRSFHVFSNGLLDGIWGLDQEGCQVFCYGGSVLACLLDLPLGLMRSYANLRRYERLIDRFPFPSYYNNGVKQEYSNKHSFTVELRKHFLEAAGQDRNSSFSVSDIDLFITAPSISAAIAKLEHVANTIAANYTRRQIPFRFVRTPNSVTIVSAYPYRPIQIISIFSKSMQDQLNRTDLDCLAHVFTGDNIIASSRCIRSLNLRANYIPSHLFIAEQRQRIFKYATRGFASICYDSNHCQHAERCDQKMENFDLSIGIQRQIDKLNTRLRPHPLQPITYSIEYLTANYPFCKTKTFDDTLEFLHQHFPQQGLICTDIHDALLVPQDLQTSLGKIKPLDWNFNIWKKSIDGDNGDNGDNGDDNEE
ncbi:hypothetical protein CYY_008548 [Polysphondylium violaceum]|uniref:Uncharacterized protein n=1 Tax=Polysphondylium violaceum TaxID=133409 RepID=A0A8J4PLF8_9MYCE|nr:hypothetical protein CYY_008548 [Polysphondylium violaceum]